MSHKQELVDLGGKNTLSLPCIARELVSVHSLESLQKACLEHDLNATEKLIMGGGSNLLLPPELNRVVLQYLGSSCRYTRASTDDILLEAEAGMMWDALVAESVSRGLYGIENLSLIPGTVGAAPVQNIGAYGVELSSLLEWVDAFNFETGAIERFDARQCQFGYRDSWFKQHPGKRLILKVCLRLSERKHFTLNYGELRQFERDSTLTLKVLRARIISLRCKKLPDPAELANAGSFFKNPVISKQLAEQLKAEYASIVMYPLVNGQYKLAAGWLIDQVGWKGVRRGPVGVHERQALVLVNYGGASRASLLELAADIQSSILEKFGVVLEIEPVIID